MREQKALKALPDAVCWVLAFVLGGKPPSALIPPKLFKHLRARGVPIFFLGVNDEEDLKVSEKRVALLGLGACNCCAASVENDLTDVVALNLHIRMCDFFHIIFILTRAFPLTLFLPHRWRNGRDRPPC